LASWRSGYAEDCKSLHPGSIPGEASNKINDLLNWTSEEKCPVCAELEAAGHITIVPSTPQTC
jgi:hypothetical protein